MYIYMTPTVPSTVLRNPVQVSTQFYSGPDFHSLVKEAVAVENKDSITPVCGMQPGVSVYHGKQKTLPAA